MELGWKTIRHQDMSQAGQSSGGRGGGGKKNKKPPPPPDPDPSSSSSSSETEEEDTQKKTQGLKKRPATGRPDFSWQILVVFGQTLVIFQSKK